MRRRALASVLLGVLISGLCLWYAFRGVDLAAMAASIGRVGAGWVLASVAGCLLSLVVRAVRWRFLLVGVEGVGMGSLVSATFVGMMANNLLPARLGEVVRAWVLARREQAQVPTVLASIVVERLLDVVALVAVLGLALVASPPLSGDGVVVYGQAGLAGLLLSAGGMVGLLFAVRYRAAILQTGGRWATKVQRAWAFHGLDLLGRFLDGLCALRSVPQAVAVVGLSLVIWAIGIVSLYVLAEGFGLGLTLVQTTLVFVIVLFGIAIPSAPGFVGTFHGFAVAGLALVAGTEPTVAAAYATLLHGSQWLAINAVGLGCLLADKSVAWSSVAALVRQG